MAVPVPLNGPAHGSLTLSESASTSHSPVNAPLPASAPPVNNSIAPLAVNSRPSLAETKYIKHGSYGCVVNPALPNKVNGEWKTFPDQITKLYFKPHNLQKALNDSNSIYNLFGKNKGHKVNSYTYKNYKGSNLPKNVRNSCGLKESNSLYAARMPHLGYDISSIDEHYKEYRNLPFKKILEQTLKVVRQLRDLAAAGKVHGDVRETNVMANPITGDITIIDFDFLMSAEEFAMEYPFGFYSNPPESLIVDNFDYFKSAVSKTSMIYRMSVIKSKAEKYVQFAGNVGFREYYHPINKDNLPNILLSNIEYMNDRINEDNDINIEFMMMELPFFDSYGLGFTLLNFYSYVYPASSTMPLTPVSLSSFKDRYGGEHTDAELTKIYNTIRQVVTDVLAPMCDPYLKSRISINTAFDRLSAIVTEFVGIEGGSRKRKTLRKTLRKSRLHKRK